MVAVNMYASIVMIIIIMALLESVIVDLIYMYVITAGMFNYLLAVVRFQTLGTKD